MDEIQAGSLYRFLRSRGTLMLGYSVYRTSATIQLAIGAGLMSMGLAFLFAPLIGGPNDLAAGAIGPMIGGGINLGMGLALKRRFSNDSSVRVQLTPEAKGLLMALHRQYVGWFSPWGQEQPLGSYSSDWRTSFRMRRLARWSGVSPDKMPTTLDSAALEQLERVAAVYNQVVGNIESGRGANPALAKLSDRILQAADESMAESLHLAATLMKYPESNLTARTQLENHIDSLGELARRVESLASESSVTQTMTAAKASIESVLDELRLEQLARSELSLPVEEAQNQRSTG